MFSFLLLEFVSFPERSDNILKQNSDHLRVSSSGSIGQYYSGKCNPTFAEHSVDSVERKNDWCSNINKSKTDYPWLNLGIDGKSILLTGYAIRSGCCYYGCCCEDDFEGTECCCTLYSWSLQGSHDNSTWKTIHKVEKDNKFYSCMNRSYDVKSEESFEFIRLIQDEPWPGCHFCICLNKIELYGSSTDSEHFYSLDDNEDSVSIIGKLRN